MRLSRRCKVNVTHGGSQPSADVADLGALRRRTDPQRRRRVHRAGTPGTLVTGMGGGGGCSATDLPPFTGSRPPGPRVDSRSTRTPERPVNNPAPNRRKKRRKPARVKRRCAASERKDTNTSYGGKIRLLGRRGYEAVAWLVPTRQTRPPQRASPDRRAALRQHHLPPAASRRGSYSYLGD